AIILLGTTKEDLGGTEYLRVIHHREQGTPPVFSPETEKAVQVCVLKLIGDGLLQSAHDCSDGGFAVTLAECCLSGPAPLGAVVRLSSNGQRRDRKSTRLNSSHVSISYAVFCLKNKNKTKNKL